MQVPRTQAEYLYGLVSLQRLFTMQVTDSQRVSIYNKICKYMHDMYEMLLIMNMQQSYADDLERQNDQLRQQLEGLGIDPYGGTGLRQVDLLMPITESRLESGALGLMLISGMICLEDGALGQTLIRGMTDLFYFYTL